jgi:hypothetical protein
MTSANREEIDALVRAAASEQDAAIYLSAAMTGLHRGELVALRWRDVDFPGQAIRVRANYSFGELCESNGLVPVWSWDGSVSPRQRIGTLRPREVLPRVRRRDTWLRGMPF